jgi:hypothetical protein
VDGGKGVGITKRGAVEEMARREAGGGERIGREESGRESRYSLSSGFCSSLSPTCEDEDRRLRFRLRSSILYSSSSSTSSKSRS